MQTRRRAASQSVENTENPVEIEIEKKKKVHQKPSTDVLVASIITSIEEENSAQKSNGSNKNDSSASKKAAKKVAVPKIVRGLPKSGRPWKETKQKFSTIKKSIHRRSFEKKEKLREELKHIKELSLSIKEEKKLENIQKKERREENAKRRLENERKSEIVQIIKNPAKLKRMKKKQLRKIEKRDLTVGNDPKVV